MTLQFKMQNTKQFRHSPSDSGVASWVNQYNRPLWPSALWSFSKVDIVRVKFSVLMRLSSEKYFFVLARTVSGLWRWVPRALLDIYQQPGDFTRQREAQALISHLSLHVTRQREAQALISPLSLMLPDRERPRPSSLLSTSMLPDRERPRTSSLLSPSMAQCQPIVWMYFYWLLLGPAGHIIWYIIHYIAIYDLDINIKHSSLLSHMIILLDNHHLYWQMSSKYHLMIGMNWLAATLFVLYVCLSASSLCPQLEMICDVNIDISHVI